MSDPNIEDAATVATGHHWLAVELLRPGMVLARPVIVAENDVLVMKLAEGTELTESSIAQIVARCVECAAIVVPPADDAARQVRLAAYVERLNLIFDCEDEIFLEEARRPLYEALRRLGPRR